MVKIISISNSHKVSGQLDFYAVTLVATVIDTKGRALEESAGKNYYVRVVHADKSLWVGYP